MTSQVDIANRALTKLGETRIIDLEDPRKPASTINSMYEIVLAAELRAHLWAFSKARAQLPALSEKPAFGYAEQFTLPADFVRLIKVANFWVYPKPTTKGLFSIEGRRLLIDTEGPLNIEYVRLVTDPNEYDALFVEAFACRLAMEACETITQSETKFNRIANMYRQALSDGLRAGAVERPAAAVQDDTWMESRR